jgi:hypothetical protein
MTSPFLFSIAARYDSRTTLAISFKHYRIPFFLRGQLEGFFVAISEDLNWPKRRVIRNKWALGVQPVRDIEPILLKFTTTNVFNDDVEMKE